MYTYNTVAYLGKDFFVRFGLTNILSGIVSGGYSRLNKIFNNGGAFFGI